MIFVINVPEKKKSRCQNHDWGTISWCYTGKKDMKGVQLGVDKDIYQRDF